MNTQVAKNETSREAVTRAEQASRKDSGALLPPVDFDALGAQEANHRLGGGQPDRCHGASPL